MQKSVDRMWDRFMNEITPQYQAMQKWKGKRRNLQAGDVVICLGDHMRNQWPVAVVKAVHKGGDGDVREVEVVIKGEERPKRMSVIRLALLVPREESSDITQ